MSDEPGSAWQVIADAAGRLLAASPTIPGARHDMGAASDYAPPGDAEVKCWADKAYRGAGGTTRAPVRGWPLKLRQRRHNSTHAGIRCLGEQAMAALKGWRLPRKLRCSTNRVTAIVKTIPAPRHAST
ncbi:transposase family protein [Streptomyces luomodiensis]|uniref:Transposase family protein n=1 Tax=Streptomyces luomodiensis TaxID=3026192 RepID=A0ABY9USF9_9ACTN|nr:transposase family protein [Streptomyces sp. SCA4-21]WNE95464.1 transposase family protein [Streptomyces sp. SCA4-21]